MFNEEASFIMGAVGTLIGLISLLPMLTTGRRWFAAISLIVGVALIIHGFYRRATRDRVTLKNVREKVRGWLDAFQILAAPLPIPDTYFVWRATLHSRLEVWVGRTHALTGYLTIVASV